MLVLPKKLNWVCLFVFQFARGMKRHNLYFQNEVLGVLNGRGFMWFIKSLAEWMG